MQEQQNKSLIRRLDLKKCNVMTDQELLHIFDESLNQIGFIPVLIELCKRQAKQIETLTKRIDYLENKTLKKPGRKRQKFYFQGKELDDEYLIYLIDYDYITLSKLEMELGAGKNQLRNRYNKAKKNLKMQKEIDLNGNM